MSIHIDHAEMTARHVIPLAKGGENTVENMQPLCRNCNSAKGVDNADYRGGLGA